MNAVVFIDYENIYWSMRQQYQTLPETGRLITSIVDLARNQGQQVWEMHAYADFDREEFDGLMTEFQRRSVEPRHVFSKTYDDGTRKNAADIEMSLDILETMYTRPEVDYFILVCGDRDMIQVIRRLRSRGKTVHVVAVERTMSKDVRSFVQHFTTVETLLGILPPAMHDLESMIRQLDACEEGKPFVGLKYFLRSLSTGESIDRAAYDLVNKAIEMGVVITHQVPNPNNERFPTTACKLNRENELVKQALANWS